MGAISWKSLIIEQKRAHGEDIASGISTTDIHSPCIVVTNLCDAVQEIMLWYPLHRIVFDPTVPPHQGSSRFPPNFNALFWDAVLKLWGRTDMPHIFFHILQWLRPELCQERDWFFWPIHFLCDTDATNAEDDTKIAAQDIKWLQIHTRREILEKLWIDENTPNYRVKVAQHFAKFWELK